MRKLKLISSLSTAALAGAFVLEGCGAEGEGASGEGEGDVIASEGEGNVSGEEENESEGAARSEDPADDDVEYLYRLGMVRGHLAAFIELYRAGVFEQATIHVKHSESELYADLAPAFDARGKSGFADELRNLANAAESRGEVEASYEAAISAVRANAPESDVRDILLAVSRLVSMAAAAFDIGVGENGAVIEPHEYQDAYGFLSAARELLSEIDTKDINASEAIAVAHEQIEMSFASFDGLVATETEGAASTIYAAAARIEIAALGL